MSVAPYSKHFEELSSVTSIGLSGQLLIEIDKYFIFIGA